MIDQVDLIYKEIALISQSFVDSNGNPIISPILDVSYVGDNAEITIPRKVSRQYTLTNVIYDGIEYTPEQAINSLDIEIVDNVIILPVDKHTTELIYIFDEKPSYEINIDIDGDGDGGGSISITTDVDGDLVTGPFYKGDLIDIIATPDEGYLFDHWEIIVGEIVIEDIFNPDTSFVMPDGSIDIGAIFKPDEDGDGIPDPEPSEKDDDDDDDDDIVSTIEDKDDQTDLTTDIETEIPDVDMSNLTDADINRLYNPYIQGYPDLEVKPNNSITRAEVMTIIYNLYGYGTTPDTSSLNDFSDVDSSKWFGDAIAFCINNGVINGYSDGTIKPDDDITRAELAAIISKFYITDGVHESPFTDIDNSWAKADRDKLYSYGLINGYSDNTYKPNQTATRAEVVTLVNRLIDRPDGYVENKSYPDLTPDFWAYEDMMNASNGGLIPGNLTK